MSGEGEVSHPILDPMGLDRLEQWGGIDLRLKMIALFFEHSPERVAGIGEGMRSGTLSLAERSAHSLKSSAANLGAERLRHLAGRAEEAAERGDTALLAHLVPIIEETFSATLEALQPYRGGGTP